MERSPDPPFHTICELIEHSDRLIWQSEQARVESLQLSRRLSALHVGSDRLVEHCRRLSETISGKHGKPPGKV